MQDSLRQFLRRAAVYAPRPAIKFVRYPREWLFANGYASFTKPESSVLFFTTHKCASTLMLRMFVLINKHCLNLTHLNLAAFMWDAQGGSGLTVHEQIGRRPTHYFRDHGIIYAPLRSYFDISHLSTAKPILMLRDPRDILVSGYYSARYSHRPPADPKRREAFLRHREDLQNISVEDYVMAYAPHTLKLYDEYRAHIPRRALLTYEQMWTDFSCFLSALADLLEVEFSSSLVDELTRMAAPPENAGQENINSHRRKGIPGDYRDKLSPEVANELTSLFADNLEWMYGQSSLGGK